MYEKGIWLVSVIICILLIIVLYNHDSTDINRNYIWIFGSAIIAPIVILLIASDSAFNIKKVGGGILKGLFGGVIFPRTGDSMRQLGIIATNTQNSLSSINETLGMQEARMEALRSEYADKITSLEEGFKVTLKTVGETHGKEIQNLLDNIEELNRKHEEEIRRLNMKSEELETRITNLIEKLNREHAEEIDRLNREHAEEIDRLNREHAEEIRMVGADIESIKVAHAEKIKRLEEEHEEKIRILFARHQSIIMKNKNDYERLKDILNAETEDLRKNHLEEIGKLNAEIERLNLQIEEIRTRCSNKIEQLKKEIKELNDDKDELSTFVERMQINAEPMLEELRAIDARLRVGLDNMRLIA